MNRAIFREFSIRGVAERDLPDPTVRQIGRAIGAYFTARGGDAMVLGRDVRRSSPRISRALGQGLAESGLTVLDAGLVPTPTLNFAVDHFGAAGGVMVTASHNPPPDNGFKLRAEETLTGAALQSIYELAVAGNYPQGPGRRQDVDALTPYLAALQERLTPAKPQRIVVDGGNGIAGRVMSDLLRRAGQTVIELFTEPDGTFPNRPPDPTAPQALVEAAELVQREGADFGLAFDGDGDRVTLIDDQGQIHLGDVILMLLARHILRAGPARIVYDVSCTRALADDVTAHGGKALAAPVGYAFVHHKMKEVGAILGGEAAGHIFYLDDEFRFDDALLAGVHLLNYIVAERGPLSRLIADLPHYHTSPNLRLACPDEHKAQVIAAITAYYRPSHPIDTIDGARITFERGWALVRQSNTQPALTVRAEGESAAAMTAIRDDVLTVVQGALDRLGEG